MERYLDYTIDARNISNSAFKVELSAKVSPDIESLYKFLQENNIVMMNWESLVREISRTKYTPHLLRLPEKEATILNALIEFANERQYTFIESARVYLDFSMGGEQPMSRDRALKKIKERILQLPKPRYDLIRFLKKKGLIPKNKEFICEILSKNI